MAALWTIYIELQCLQRGYFWWQKLEEEWRPPGDRFRGFTILVSVRRRQGCFTRHLLRNNSHCSIHFLLKWYDFHCFLMNGFCFAAWLNASTQHWIKVLSNVSDTAVSPMANISLQRGMKNVNCTFCDTSPILGIHTWGQCWVAAESPDPAPLRNGPQRGALLASSALHLLLYMARHTAIHNKNVEGMSLHREHLH